MMAGTDHLGLGRPVPGYELDLMATGFEPPLVMVYASSDGRSPQEILLVDADGHDLCEVARRLSVSIPNTTFGIFNQELHGSVGHSPA